MVVLVRSREILFRMVFGTWMIVLFVLLAIFVMRLVGVGQYPSFTVVLLFLVPGGYAALWGMDPACRGQFLRSRYVRRRLTRRPRGD